MSAALVVHIVGGGLGIAFGAAALAVRKGARLHRASGGVFVTSMLAMSAAAALLALSLPDWANLPGALLVFYLVVTGWAAVTRNRGTGRRLAEQGGLVLGGAAAASALLLAFQAHASATGLINGKPAPMFAIFAVLAAVAVSLDLRTLRLVDPPRSQRLARHIWRMCMALFFGTGSFFLGQQKVMPVWLQGSPVLFALAFAPLFLMGFWMIKTVAARATPITACAA